MNISIIIRTYNEEKYLDKLLSLIKNQKTGNLTFEVIIVDSGSTDNTLSIAIKHSCIIHNIEKKDFSFGKSLNIGCHHANGEILVFISGHCYPSDSYWLINLVKPIIECKIVLSYGKQIGDHTSKYSELNVFKKYYPDFNKIPQKDIFCNNANAAILKNIWEKYKYDENLTGLEDMHIAKRIKNDGLEIGYVADACVYHLHNESWKRIKNRFEREAIALQDIMPEVHVTFFDCIRYFVTSVFLDYKSSLNELKFKKNIFDIIFYRSAQYLGAYFGNHNHRKISKKNKEKYFFPK